MRILETFHSVPNSQLVFIAGPYFGDGKYETIEANVKEAERYAIALANRGVFFFCPHIHTSHFGYKAKNKDGENYYKALDFVYLKMCKGILMMPRWKESSGARDEHEWAMGNNLNIFYPKSPNDNEVMDILEKWAKWLESKVP